MLAQVDKGIMEELESLARWFSFPDRFIFVRQFRHVPFQMAVDGEVTR